MTGLRVARPLAVVALSAAALAPVARPAYAVAHGEEHTVFRIQSSEVTESSSLVVSTTHDGLAYTTNDSGDSAIVYVVDTATGDVVGRTTLEGVDATDVEALAGGADGTLVVADIGDNTEVREAVEVYRIEQPGPGDDTVTPDVLTLRYADGPRDAESVLYDAESGRVFVVSKEIVAAQVYRTGPDAFERGGATLQPVAAAPPLATDATYLPGQALAVIRGYTDAAVFRTDGWQRLAGFDLPKQRQGESITAPSDDVVWVGSEGPKSPVLEVDLPALPETTPTTSSPPTTETPTAGGGAPDQTAAEDSSPAAQLALWVGAAAAVGLGVVVLLLLVRGRRSARH